MADQENHEVPDAAEQPETRPTGFWNRLKAIWNHRWTMPVLFLMSVAGVLILWRIQGPQPGAAIEIPKTLKYELLAFLGLIVLVILFLAFVAATMIGSGAGGTLRDRKEFDLGIFKIFLVGANERSVWRRTIGSEIQDTDEGPCFKNYTEKGEGWHIIWYWFGLLWVHERTESLDPTNRDPETHKVNVRVPTETGAEGGTAVAQYVIEIDCALQRVHIATTSAGRYIRPPAGWNRAAELGVSEPDRERLPAIPQAATRSAIFVNSPEDLQEFERIALESALERVLMHQHGTERGGARGSSDYDFDLIAWEATLVYCKIMAQYGWVGEVSVLSIRRPDEIERASARRKAAKDEGTALQELISSVSKGAGQEPEAVSRIVQAHLHREAAGEFGAGLGRGIAAVLRALKKSKES